jgi:hypothetical protein
MEIHAGVTRIGAWSYLPGQLFLAGPLQVLRAIDKLRARIPSSPSLERELLALRDELRA